MKLTAFPPFRIIAEKPWLLVIGLFVVVTVMWVSVFTLSLRYPAIKIDAGQEAQLLKSLHGVEPATP